ERRSARPWLCCVTALRSGLRDYGPLRGITIAIFPDASASASIGHVITSGYGSPTAMACSFSAGRRSGAGKYVGVAPPKNPEDCVGCPPPWYAGVPPPPKKPPKRPSQPVPVSASGWPAP